MERKTKATSAQNDSDTSSEIADLTVCELTWNKLIAENKVKEMGEYMHKDWIVFSGDGNITTKKGFLDAIQNGDLIHTRMDFEILRVMHYGNTGIVIQRGTSAGTWKGKSFSNYEIASSVFIKGPQGWQAVMTMLAPAINQTE